MHFCPFSCIFSNYERGAFPSSISFSSNTGEIATLFCTPPYDMFFPKHDYPQKADCIN